MEPLTKEEWRLRRKKIKKIKLTAVGVLTLTIFILLIFTVKSAVTLIFQSGNTVTTVKLQNGTKVTEQLLTPNANSRPQISLEEVKGIVIHYVGNAGSTASANRNYFEGLKDSKVTSASSHFIVGLDGEIIQCIPLNEIAYASNSRNLDTVSIEFCHEEKDGIPSDKTYESLVELSASLCKQYKLTSKDIIRHYDVTEKNCPKYYVENEDAWEEFLQDVENKLKNM